MNKKGQTLVIFIILIPLLLILGAFIVDNSIIVYKNLQLKNTTRDIIKMNFEKRALSDEEIKNVYYKNDIPTNDIKINRGEDSLNIRISYFTESIFGKLINMKSYEVSTNIKGILENDKVIFE